MHRHAWIYKFYQDSDTGYVFAIGICWCAKEVLIVCKWCEDTMMVLSGALVCPTCDQLGELWQPRTKTSTESTNESTCGNDESKEKTHTQNKP